MNRWLFFVVIALSTCTGCSSGEGNAGTNGAGGGATSSTGSGGALPPIGGDRPVEVTEPDHLEPGAKAPLVLLLHGYGVSGLVEDIYMGLKPVARQKGFFYAFPTGTLDAKGSYWWNSTGDGSMVDDSAYLVGLIDEIIARYAVDPKRVFLIGHSNGGFMAYRMACEHADKIAAIASLAGGMWLPPIDCQPSEAVHVAQIHGTADDTVLYDGSAIGPVDGTPGYVAAEATVQAWATFGGCSLTPDMSAPPLDLEVSIAGAETTVERYTQGCNAGGSAELWSVAGGGHIPQIGDQFRESVTGFLLSHPKP